MDETSGIKSQTDAQGNGQRDHETGGRATQPRAPQTIEVNLESRQEQQERETEQGQHLQRQIHLYESEDGRADHDTGYDLKYHGGQMQCRCEAEQERHCEGYRCYDQYSRKRDVGHHESILCGVCCLDVRSNMTVHPDKHLMLVPDRLTVATT